MKRFRVAVDIGGTFTDVVLFDRVSGRVQAGKVLTTPSDRSRGVLEGVRQLVADLSELSYFVHGTTAGLNAFLERKGARVALLVTEGFGDVYEIGRANRPDIYDLHYRKPRPLVRRRDIFEVRERVLADGGIDRPLESAAVAELGRLIRGSGYGAVAVALLHSWINPEHERQVGQILQEVLSGIPISLSHQVANEWREYERTSTTVLNAYISPVMASYLTNLEDNAKVAGFSEDIHIMQSNGGVMTSGTAKEHAVQTMFSGPVGGTIGSLQTGKQLGLENLIGIDMGGTSFDVSLVIGGRPEVTNENQIEGLPVLTPVVNIHTIGAGGGSIAWIEAGGLRVGPQSAGAEPGPACYGRGGTDPTVTDANLVLGKIDPRHFLGGRMHLDLDAARAAVRELGGRLGLSEERAAEGIIAVTNAKMTNAIREITVARGIDPREYALVAYGGAGPMHAVFLAAELGIPRIIVPLFPGAFSAGGMLHTDIRHDLSRTFFKPLSAVGQTELALALGELEKEGEAVLAHERVTREAMRFALSADLRYAGQEYTVNVPFPGNRTDASALADLGLAFDQAHLARYGHNNPGEPVEFVNLRLAAFGILDKPSLSPLEGTTEQEAPAEEVRSVWFDGGFIPTSLYLRDRLRPGHRLRGPAVVEELSCTTVIPPEFSAKVDPFGNIIISSGEDRL